MRTTPEKFLSRLVPNGECLEYTKHQVHGTNYGQLSWGGTSRRAHRVAWEIANGPIPDGLWVLHKCDNPACCRIEHLYLGTHADNERDVQVRGRRALRGRPGTANHRAVLTPEQVAEIRSLRGTMSQPQIGRRFGISAGHVGAIHRGERWAA